MKNLKDLQLHELKELLAALGEKPFRAGQIFSWLYRSGGESARSIDEMTDLSLALREKLKEAGCHAGVLEPERVQISRLDGTRKYLFRLTDGNAIESVLMKYKYGNTVCVSSQAGCRMGCAFCASAIGGLARGLSAGEMAEQLLAVERESGQTVNHIVVMGTGEPFDNYDNLAAFIRNMNDKAGRNLGMRSITVSTCGLAPVIERFAHDFPQVNLAISLHAPSDEIRSRMMPVNRKYPLAVLIPACRRYCELTSRRVTFEYTLVRGVNDSPACAQKLAALLSGMLCHVNLIPLNRVEETGLMAAEGRTAAEFRAYLESHGVPATIRREMGADIDGACGQLRLSASAHKNGEKDSAKDGAKK